jgi:hypothetical protein
MTSFPLTGHERLNDNAVINLRTKIASSGQSFVYSSPSIPLLPRSIFTICFLLHITCPHLFSTHRDQRSGIFCAVRDYLF